jgi:hypothetical protein
MYMLLGTVLAKVNMSACRVPLPNRSTSSINRPKPSTREVSVPAAIRAPAETSFEVLLGLGSVSSGLPSVLLVRVSDIDAFRRVLPRALARRVLGRC